MPVTYVVECNQCSGLLLASAEQKSRTCPFCGSRVNLLKVKRIVAADNSLIASEVLRKLKAERQFNTKKPPTKLNPSLPNRTNRKTRLRQSRL